MALASCESWDLTSSHLILSVNEGFFPQKASVLRFNISFKVEAVNFVDDLHGECYVELKSTDDLAHALDKHALRVGTRTRKRLIEVHFQLSLSIFM